MHYGVEVLFVRGGGVVIVRTFPRPRLATVCKSGLQVHTRMHLNLTIALLSVTTARGGVSHGLEFISGVEVNLIYNLIYTYTHIYIHYIYIYR